MNSIFPFLFFAVLSGFLSGCQSERSSLWNVPQNMERPYDSIPFRNSERLTSRAAYFQPSNDNVALQLDDGEPGKRQKTLKISTLNRPPCARNKVYCTYDNEYDDAIKDQFKIAIENSKMNKEALGMMTHLMVDPIEPISSSRNNLNFNEESVCPSRVQLIFPKRGINQNDEWVFILNQDNFEQGIKIETCAKDNRQTQSLSKSSTTDMRCDVRSVDSRDSVCLQKFIYRNVLTMNKSGTNITTEAILVPSCCACIKRRKIISFKRISSRHLNRVNNGNIH